MSINKLIFETGKYDIDFYAPNGKRKFELGKIRPTIDGKFSVVSEHFEFIFNNDFKKIEKAKEFAQKQFEKWVQDFSVNNYKNEYIVE